MSTERRKKVLKVAMELFLHFGFRRTTIADIANEAGISRPTLYAMYPNKEAIFAAVLESYMEDLEARIDERFDPSDSWSNKVRLVLELAVVEPFSRYQGSSIKRELFSIEDPPVREMIEELTGAMERVYGRCFEGHEELLSRLDRTPLQLGRVVNAACHGMKERARDQADLEMMLDTMLTLLESP
jgi:AcrR family transcriptional regulator